VVGGNNVKFPGSSEDLSQFGLGLLAPEDSTLVQTKGRPGPRVSKQPPLFDEEVAISNEGKTTDAVSPQVLAQQLKILRVLRFVVLPEMAKRLM
jgi:hypothetical protein